VIEKKSRKDMIINYAEKNDSLESTILNKIKMIIEFKKYIIIIDSKLTYRKQGFFLTSLAIILR
jgi:hypothetical protein